MTCPACNGSGTWAHYERHPYGDTTGFEIIYDECPACIGEGKCPGCLADGFDPVTPCRHCGYNFLSTDV